MDSRLSRESSLQKKALENRRIAERHVPNLTNFMNDMFFGTVNNDKKPYYNLTGTGKLIDDDEDFDSSTRSNSSKLTQEWLEEARRMVASSPSRCDSPSRLVGSPRFAAAQPGRPSMSSSLERKDPLSRSARRYLITSSLHLTFTHLIKFNDCFLSNNMNMSQLSTGTGQWKDSVEKFYQNQQNTAAINQKF